MQYLFSICITISTISAIRGAEQEFPHSESMSPRMLALRNRMYNRYPGGGSASIAATYQRTTSKLVIAQPLTPTASKSGDHTNRSIHSGSNALSVATETKSSEAQANKLQTSQVKKHKPCLWCCFSSPAIAPNTDPSHEAKKE